MGTSKERRHIMKVVKLSPTGGSISYGHVITSSDTKGTY